ncbi:MAG: hypothetical protein IPO90_01830 [Flavobacteriales bacterium]|nr:hypothetical protein [Flavobacteriales bacterium]
MEKKVFISVGRRFKPEQEKFLEQLQALLIAGGVTPVIFGKTAFSSGQPLQAIKDLMGQCDGTMILAFERVHIKEGKELRGGSEERDIVSANLPTAWNQVEASMAYALGHPLFMVAENGLRSEGLIEKGYDWWVQWVDLNSNVFTKTEFAGGLKDWLNRVKEHKRPEPLRSGENEYRRMVESIG